MSATAAPVAGATALSQRALGPDLARGAMLLFIALANSHYFLIAAARSAAATRRTARPWTACVIWLLATFVDGRAFPMFGLLFGYGVAQIVRRHEALGRWPVRRMLWRRALCLVVVGFLHAMLLYVGDILAAYGVLLLVGAWVVWWRDRWLLVWAALLFVLDRAAVRGLGVDQHRPAARLDAAAGPAARCSRNGSSCSRSSCCSARSGSPARSWSGSGPGVAGSSSGRSEHRPPARLGSPSSA